MVTNVTTFNIRSLYFYSTKENKLNLLIMKKNMGTADRIIRIIVAILFGALYFSGTVTGTLGYIMLALGGVFILTSMVSFCPLYSIVGLSTCPTKKA